MSVTFCKCPPKPKISLAKPVITGRCGCTFKSMAIPAIKKCSSKEPCKYCVKLTGKITEIKNCSVLGYFYWYDLCSGYHQSPSKIYTGDSNGVAYINYIECFTGGSSHNITFYIDHPYSTETPPNDCKTSASVNLNLTDASLISHKIKPFDPCDCPLRINKSKAYPCGSCEKDKCKMKYKLMIGLKKSKNCSYQIKWLGRDKYFRPLNKQSIGSVPAGILSDSICVCVGSGHHYSYDVHIKVIGINGAEKIIKCKSQIRPPCCCKRYSKFIKCGKKEIFTIKPIMIRGTIRKTLKGKRKKSMKKSIKKSIKKARKKNKKN